MKSSALCALFLALVGGSIWLHAESADPETAAIRLVAEGYLSGDPARIREAFLPSMNLYTTDSKEELRTIPFAEYIERVSANAPKMQQEERQSRIDLIDRTGNVAIVKITTTRPQAIVTDYLSLVRIEKQWKVVSKAFFVEPASGATPNRQTPSSPDSACADENHHRFAFMIGSWSTSDPGRGELTASEGESSVETMLAGCIVHEHRTLSRQGKRLFDGDAYWGFDSTKKQWLLFYMDDQSHMQLYEGREQDGRLAFYRERPDADGKPVLIRIVYAPLDPSSYTQTVERSTDKGATWQPGGVTTYKAKR